MIKLYVWSLNLLSHVFLCNYPRGVLYQMTLLPFGHYGYFQTCSSTKALGNQILEPEVIGRRSESKQAQILNNFCPHWEHILIGNNVCVNLTRAVSPWPDQEAPAVRVGKKKGRELWTRREKQWVGVEIAQDTERNAAAGKWMRTQIRGKWNCERHQGSEWRNGWKKVFE